MRTQGRLDGPVYDAARAQPLQVADTTTEANDSRYFLDFLRRPLPESYDTEMLSAAGLQIHSTPNPPIQRAADAASRDQLYAPRRRGAAEVTLANIDRTGELIGWRPEIPFDDGLAEMIESARLGDWS